MFPTDLKQIAMAAIGLLFLVAMRVPAVLLATRRMGLGKKEFWFLSAAIPRGLAAGVLATLPMHYGLPGAENLVPVIFAVIVLSVLVFAIGFTIVGRLPTSPHPLNDHGEVLRVLSTTSPCARKYFQWIISAGIIASERRSATPSTA
jgi:NhaP-type Na+/H+ and K+/H+ antiporter